MIFLAIISKHFNVLFRLFRSHTVDINGIAALPVMTGAAGIKFRGTQKCSNMAMRAPRCSVQVYTFRVSLLSGDELLMVLLAVFKQHYELICVPNVAALACYALAACLLPIAVDIVMAH